MSHFIEDRIAHEVHMAELRGDTSRIARQVKEAQEASKSPLPQSPSPSDQSKAEYQEPNQEPN